MAQRQKRWWVRSIVLGSSLLLLPVGAWADKLGELEQAFDSQQKSLQQLRQEMNRLRQERTAQQEEMSRRVMEVEKKAAEAASSSFQVGYDNGFFLKSADDKFKLRFRGYLQQWFIAEGEREENELTAAARARHTPSTFRARRVRFILDGKLFNDFGFYLEPDITGNARLEEGWVSYTYAPWAKLTLGQHKPRFGLEMLTSSRELDYAERAVVSRALSPDFQLGLTVEGNLLGNMVYYGVGVSNGCGRIDQCPGGIDNDGDKEATGRIALTPPMPIGTLTIAGNADYRTFRLRNGTGATDANDVTRIVSGRQNFNPRGVTGVRLTDNGYVINGNRVTGGGDLVYELYPFILKAEYAFAFQERDALGPGGSELDDLNLQGGYASLGYWISGNKKQGLLANARYEYFRVDDEDDQFTRPAIAGNTERPMQMHSGTAGLTWFFNPQVRLRANYILTDVRPGANLAGISNSKHGEIAHEGIAEVFVQF